MLIPESSIGPDLHVMKFAEIVDVQLKKVRQNCLLLMGSGDDFNTH